MKMACLRERLDRMPMLKAVIPFAVGIALAEVYVLPLWFLAGAFALSGVLALWMRSSAWAVAMLFVVGFGVRQLREPRATVPLETPMLCEITIGEFPADRGRFTAAEAIIDAWRNPADGSWHAAADRALLYADSSVVLSGGERLRCRAAIRPLGSGEASYRQLMARRGFAGTLFLSRRNLLEQLPTQAGSLHRRAAGRLATLGVGGDAGAVVRAMTVADRSGIGAELRTRYARSGMSHLLAVSGLHTGIVFGVVNLLLWWLPLLRRGHLLRNLLVGAAVWLYVAAAGFPPSAVRAAVMCSLLQFALAAGSGYMALNALAAAAFGMLLWNPLWIGDIGFRLSFVAVAGILAWGVPLHRRLRTRYRAVNGAVDALGVALVATAATLPLVSHTFGIVPLVGALVSPVAVALAGVVVGCGVLWLVAPILWAAPVIGFVAERCATALNVLAEWTAALPGGVVEYRLSEGMTIVCYLVFLLATAVAWCAEPKKSVHLRK